jgi:hypothetical protein
MDWIRGAAANRSRSEAVEIEMPGGPNRSQSPGSLSSSAIPTTPSDVSHPKHSPASLSGKASAGDPLAVSSTGFTVAIKSRSGLRYEDAALESSFLQFSHRSQVSRCALVVLCCIAFAGRASSATLSFGEQYTPVVFTVAAVLTLCFLWAIYSIPALHERLPARIRASAHVLVLGNELVVAVAPIALRCAEQSPYRTHWTIELPDGTTGYDSYLFQVGMPLLWQICIAPPRLLTILPLLAPLIALISLTVAGKTNGSAVDVAASSIVVAELGLTLWLLAAFERTRRANFEASLVVTWQSERGQRLVESLRSTVTRSLACVAGRKLVPMGDSAATRYGTVVVIDGSTIARGAEVLAKDVLGRTLQEALRVLHRRISGCTFVTFGSSSTLVCLAVLADDNDGPADGGETPSQLAARAACVVVRAALHAFATEFSTSQSREGLRVALDSGPLTLLQQAPGVISGLTEIVAGRAVSTAVRMSELALPGTALVSEDTLVLIRHAYGASSVRRTVVEGRSVSLHLLGMAFDDRAMQLEGRVTDRIDAWCMAEFPGETVRSQSVPAHNGGETISDLCTELIAADNQPVGFRFTFPWGWLFDDLETEAAYRRQEGAEIVRFLPACTIAGFTVLAVPLTLSADPSAMPGASWAFWSLALVLSFIQIMITRTSLPGQGRLLVVTLLHTVTIALLAVALYFVESSSCPTKTVFLSAVIVAMVTKLPWLPSVYPAIFELGATQLLFELQRLLVKPYKRDFWQQDLPTMGIAFAIMQLFRYRNRHRYAQYTAAQRSVSRWHVARDALVGCFAQHLPYIVAERVVRDGTLVQAASAQCAVDSTLVASVPLDFSLKIDQAFVIALHVRPRRNSSRAPSVHSKLRNLLDSSCLSAATGTWGEGSQASDRMAADDETCDRMRIDEHVAAVSFLVNALASIRSALETARCTVSVAGDCIVIAAIQNRPIHCDSHSTVASSNDDETNSDDFAFHGDLLSTVLTAAMAPSTAASAVVSVGTARGSLMGDLMGTSVVGKRYELFGPAVRAALHDLRDVPV